MVDRQMEKNPSEVSESSSKRQTHCVLISHIIILHHHCSSQCDTRNKTNLEIYTTHTVGLVNLVIIYVKHNRSPSDFCLIFWKTSAENCSWQERCVPNGTVFMCLNHCIYTGTALALNITSVHTVYWQKGHVSFIPDLHCGGGGHVSFKSNS